MQTRLRALKLGAGARESVLLFADFCHFCIQSLGLGIEGLGLGCLPVVRLVQFSAVQSVVLSLALPVKGKFPSVYTHTHLRVSLRVHTHTHLAFSVYTHTHLAFSVSGLMGVVLCK